MNHAIKSLAGINNMRSKMKAENGVLVGPPATNIAPADATKTAGPVRPDYMPRFLDESLRPDGTLKDVGYLGQLKTPSGKIVTEYSVGVPVMGKQMDIPTIVPGLSKQEVDYIIQKAESGLPIGKDSLGNAIVKKATIHAEQRIKKGLSPFYSSVMDKKSVPVMAADATKVNRFPIPPEKDARRPRANIDPYLGTAYVRMLKNIGPYVGSDIKTGGHPNESFSDVVFRLSHTKGKPAYAINKNVPSAMPLLAAAGEVFTDPVNIFPYGDLIGGGIKRLAQASNIRKLANSLNALAFASKGIEPLHNLQDFITAYGDYISRPEPPKPAMTKQQADLVNQITKNIGQQKFGQ
jgi:hypothetical protein